MALSNFFIKFEFFLRFSLILVKNETEEPLQLSEGHENRTRAI